LRLKIEFRNFSHERAQKTGRAKSAGEFSAGLAERRRPHPMAQRRQVLAQTIPRLKQPQLQAIKPTVLCRVGTAHRFSSSGVRLSKLFAMRNHQPSQKGPDTVLQFDLGLCLIRPGRLSIKSMVSWSLSSRPSEVFEPLRRDYIRDIQRLYMPAHPGLE
jgi:hypothetical protein